MKIKNKLNRSLLNQLDEFDRLCAEDKLRQRIPLLQQLAKFSHHVSHPASGETYQRWQYFAYIAGIDLSLVKLFESHCDAVSILHELNASPIAFDEVLAVWAAEGGSKPLHIENQHCNGIKPWCSGANFIDQALMTYRTAEHHSQLCLVKLDQTSVTQDLSHWHARGMQPTETAQVSFENTSVVLIGQPNAYLKRAGFWHGAAGVAACWYGAAVRLVNFLQESCANGSDHFKNMYLGQLATCLSVTQNYFKHIAALIDAQPQLSHEREIRILRAQTEECCLHVITWVGKALGARPYCEKSTFADLMADLPVFIRQSHAAFDDEKIAELSIQEHSTWAL